MIAIVTDILFVQGNVINIKNIIIKGYAVTVLGVIKKHFHSPEMKILSNINNMSQRYYAT